MRSFALVFSLHTCVAAASFSVCPNGAAAQAMEDPSGRELFEEGIAYEEAGEWEKALAAYWDARLRDDRPSLDLNIGRALFNLRRYGEATQAFDRLLNRPQPGARRAVLAKELRDKALPETATVQMRLSPPDAASSAIVEMYGNRHEGDEPERTLPINVGASELVVSAEGYQSQTLSVRASAAGEVVVLDVALERVVLPEQALKPMPDESVWESPWLWTGVGLVVVGAAVALLFLIPEDPALDTGSSGKTIEALTF